MLVQMTDTGMHNTMKTVFCGFHAALILIISRKI